MEPGIWQIVIVIGIVVLLFGAKKIPELAKGVGEGITEFKNATKKQVEEGKSKQVNESVGKNNSEKPKEEVKAE